MFQDIAAKPHLFFAFDLNDFRVVDDDLNRAVTKPFNGKQDRLLHVACLILIGLSAMSHFQTSCSAKQAKRVKLQYSDEH